MSVEEMKVIKDGVVCVGLIALFAWVVWLEYRSEG